MHLEKTLDCLFPPKDLDSMTIFIQMAFLIYINDKGNDVLEIVFLFLYTLQLYYLLLSHQTSSSLNKYKVTNPPISKSITVNNCNLPYPFNELTCVCHTEFDEGQQRNIQGKQNAFCQYESEDAFVKPPFDWQHMGNVGTEMVCLQYECENGSSDHFSGQHGSHNEGREMASPQYVFGSAS